MWKGKEKGQIKPAIVLLMLVVLLTIVFGGIGIDSSDPDWHRLYNDDSNYFIHKTQGLLVSQDANKVQASMEWCFQAKAALFSTSEICVDSITFNWIYDTDSTTFARLIGSTSYSVGGFGTIDLNIIYALDTADMNRLRITPQVKNNTSLNITDFNITFRHKDINMDFDGWDDRLKYFKDGEQDYALYNLALSNITALDWNYYQIYDLGDIKYWWNSEYTRDDMNYPMFYIFSTPTIPNKHSKVSVKYLLGSLGTGSNVQFNTFWKDAKVPTAITLMHPDSNLTYDFNTNIKADCFVTVGGTGGASNYVGSLEEATNGTFTAGVQNVSVNNSASIITIIQGDANPISTSTTNVDLNWTLTGANASGGTRYVRCKADSNNTTGCRAAAPCYSTVRELIINPPPQNREIDINVVKIDGNLDNLALPVFWYNIDGNITIDFNVYDADCAVGVCNNLDANIDYRDVNGQSYRIITNLELTTAGICNDTDFASNDNNIGTTCRWDWNNMNVPDSNFWIDINVTDNNVNGTKSQDFNRSDQNFRARPFVPPPPSNNLPTIKATRPNGGEVIGVRDGNYRIDFNVSDADFNFNSGVKWNNRLDVNIDYNFGKVFTRIVTDLNLMYVTTPGNPKTAYYCDDLNFAGYGANSSVTCHYDWNLSINYPSQKMTLDLNIQDNNGSAAQKDMTDQNFRLHNWLVSSSSTATAYNNSRKLARNADGNRIYLVYEGNPPTSTNKEVWFVQSDNNGSTWTTPVNVSSNSGGSINPVIDVNSSGGIHVFWDDNSFGVKREILYKSCSQNCNVIGNWSSDVNISNNPGNSDYPSIDINSTGGLHIVWEDDTNQSLSVYEIRYKSCSVNCGAINNWSNDFNISQNSTKSRYPSIDINSTDGIHIVWEDG